MTVTENDVVQSGASADAMNPRTSFVDTNATLDWRVDLLRPVEEMVDCLVLETGSLSYLNAFLLAVAIQQAVDDQLASASVVDRAVEYLGKHNSVWGTIAKATLGPVSKMSHRITGAALGRHGLNEWRMTVDEIVQDLATIVVKGHDGFHHPQLEPRLVALAASAPALPRAVRSAIPVLPSCFQTFDLGIDDIRRLADRVDESISATPVPVIVVGVRTSGSYLAPLMAAVLRARGRSDVSTVTLRPGVPFQGRAAGLARLAARAGAAFVVTDDPPVSGSSLARAVEELQRLGVPKESVTVAYPRFTEASTVLTHLAGYRQVSLPWADWAVHTRLAPEAVGSDLAALLGDGVSVESVRALEHRALSRSEAHVRARYLVHVVDRSSSEERTLNVAVQGVGIGYYGEHVRVVAGILAAYAPHMYGLRSGLLYREWLDDQQRVITTGEPRTMATALAGYAAERSRCLRVPDDRSLRLAGSRPAWEAAAVEVSHTFGRAWPFAQLFAVNPVVRQLMKVHCPTVIDGTMDLENWFTAEQENPEQLRSVGLQRRAYWHHGLSSYDPVFDLAGAMTADLDVALPGPMLAEYTARTRDVVSPERWMLLRLAQLWGARRRRADPAAVRSAGARALQEYFARVFFADVDAAPADGPVCALDIDGVLETDHLGFPSLTASSASALRALRMHGCRPVLVTGRSLDDVRERCVNYGLVGGVAEYGSAVYLASGDTVVDLVPADARTELAALRSKLASVPGVVVDERYRFGVRAWTKGARATNGLADRVIDSVTADFHHIRVVPGEGQTDFVAASIDKGSGLRRLMVELTPAGAPSSGRTPALAIGDTASDAAMLALARQGAVPGHAVSMLDGPGIWRSRHPYQHGLADMVDRYLGHSNGGKLRLLTGSRVPHSDCDTCRPLDLHRPREALLALLSASESGMSGMPFRVLRALWLGRSLR